MRGPPWFFLSAGTRWSIYAFPESSPKSSFPENSFQQKKVKVDIAPLGDWTSLQKRLGVARFVEKFHSFTRTSTRLSTNGMNHTCLCFPSRSWSSFTDLGWIYRWDDLGTTTVSKQSAQGRYVTAITVVSYSNRHASLGNWSVAAMSVEYLTSWAMSRDATTESPSHSWSCFSVTPIFLMQYNVLIRVSVSSSVRHHFAFGLPRLPGWLALQAPPAAVARCKVTPPSQCS